ncbi:MAG: competence/damage-inducible protein A [Dehalococcoidia bacterium]
MKAEIVSIGTEILLGQITDLNAPYIASLLPSLGIDLYRIHQLGDNKDRLADTFRQAWSRADLILTTGGLGPTQDDVTRESIAELVGEEMKVDPELEKQLREFFKDRNYPMPLSNLKQATLIPSAQPIYNPRGTAPGWWVEKDGRYVIAMPGPPAEMQRMWNKEVSPRLRKIGAKGVLVSRTLKTFGISEGGVDEMVASLLSSTNPTIGVYAKHDGIQLRITAKGEDEASADGLLVDMEKKVREMLGNSIWGEDEDTLEGNVARLLLLKGYSLATMESCSGGWLASSITDVPGSSKYFKGGTVSYTNEMKIASGVDPAIISRHGAISAKTAEAMARACRQRQGADVGVSITGVAGPDKSEGKSPGTVYIGIATPEGSESFYRSLPGNRQLIKQRAAIAALYELQRTLQNLG